MFFININSYGKKYISIMKKLIRYTPGGRKKKKKKKEAI
jgi:hypothetical protein